MSCEKHRHKFKKVADKSWHNAFSSLVDSLWPEEPVNPCSFSPESMSCFRAGGQTLGLGVKLRAKLTAWGICEQQNINTLLFTPRCIAELVITLEFCYYTSSSQFLCSVFMLMLVTLTFCWLGFCLDWFACLCSKMLVTYVWWSTDLSEGCGSGKPNCRHGGLVLNPCEAFQCWWPRKWSLCIEMWNYRTAIRYH